MFGIENIKRYFASCGRANDYIFMTTQDSNSFAVARALNLVIVRVNGNFVELLGDVPVDTSKVTKQALLEYCNERNQAQNDDVPFATLYLNENCTKIVHYYAIPLVFISIMESEHRLQNLSSLVPPIAEYRVISLMSMMNKTREDLDRGCLYEM